MSILCLWNPIWSTGEESIAELAPLLLQEAPRVAMESRGMVWVDSRGMPAKHLAERLLDRLAANATEGTRVGLASVPVVAEAAARTGKGRITIVPPGEEAHFLASRPLALLAYEERDESLLALLEGAGIQSCGNLAALTPDAIEVRFSAEGVRLWKLARGDDRRLLFRPIPPEFPYASTDFIDYTIRDAARLVFVLNALLDRVCDTLRDRALRARVVTLGFALAGGGTVREVLRTASPTADRSFWIRRIRAALDGLKLRDAIAGVSLEAGASDPVSGVQGDLFDRGFATMAFVEETVARLLDTDPRLFVRQVRVPHLLAERRVSWAALTPHEVSESSKIEDLSQEIDPPPVAALALRLLPEPRPIHVRTELRRDHHLPVRFRADNGWRDLEAAGPDRVSAGADEDRPVSREYYRCVSDEGTLLWIYRDTLQDRWYLHGWWD